MLEKTRGVILKTVKYGNDSLILTVYTRTMGRRSFIINAARTSRSKNKAGLLQPLFIVEMDVYFRERRDLQRIREIRLALPFLSIPFDIRKSAQAMLIAETLYKVIVEEEHNPGLYQFIESSLVHFDAMESGLNDFHIWFLSRLTGYLGIMPNIREKTSGWLDMQSGEWIAEEPPHHAYMDPRTTALFDQLTRMNIPDLPEFHISPAERVMLLNKVLEYYHLHFGNFSGITSSEILKQVFH